MRLPSWFGRRLTAFFRAPEAASFSISHLRIGCGQKSSVALRGCHSRLLGFVSTASDAESFRSRCGSVRRAPVCSSHASPIAAPQVEQGTDNICFSVSSLVFTTTLCNVRQLGKCSIMLIFNALPKRQVHCVRPAVFNNYEQK